MEQQDVVTFACEECGKSITVPAEQLGQLEVCPHCHEYVDVPNHSACEGPSATPPRQAEADSCKQPDGRRATGRLWFEVTAVLALAVIPDLFAAVAMTVGWSPSSYSFVYLELWLIIRALQVSLPLLLILRLTGEPWARFGIVRFSWRLDVPTASPKSWSCVDTF